MPGTMTEREHPLSLLSVEVLVGDVQIDMNIECHLPCIVFRLLDYPAVSIPYFDQWEVDDFHSVKRAHPHVSWRQLLSDQFYELRAANGKFQFKRGKSCLFKTYLKTLYAHLLNVPLFLLLIDQINDKGDNANTTQFIGSCNLKLNELIEMLNQSVLKNGNDIPLVEQQTFHSTLFNLMGTPIGTCNVAVRFCHYGTTILTQLPMLDEPAKAPVEDKSRHETRGPVSEPSAKPSVVTAAPATDTVVKHIHFVNEKRDVGLQISRSELPPPTEQQSKSAQTRWTSTKNQPVHRHSKRHTPRSTEDPMLDDLSIASYQPPALYFNSNSDFLQMMTPRNARVVHEAKENRLSYLASIPIGDFDDGFDDDDDDDDEENAKRHPPERMKPKGAQSVRFNLASSSSSPPPLPPPEIILRTRVPPKPSVLTQDFLHSFPLLRALVEEALTLQQQSHDAGVPMPLVRAVLGERPRSAGQQGPRKLKPSPTRPKTAMMVRQTRTKSVIVPRNINNTRRLYPPPPDARQMVVTKSEVRSLVDRLSKPKFNKRLEQELLAVEQPPAPDEPIVTPRTPPKPASARPGSAEKKVVAQKPPLSYGTTRAHRLYAEYARARRAASEPQPSAGVKPPITPRKDVPPGGRIQPASPQLLNTGTLSHFSLLNKVDVDTATLERNSIPQPSPEQTQQLTRSDKRSSSTTSQDVTLELNQSASGSSSSTSTPEPTLPDRDPPSNQDQNELGFSITEETDYFAGSDHNASTRPSTQQSP